MRLLPMALASVLLLSGCQEIGPSQLTGPSAYCSPNILLRHSPQTHRSARVDWPELASKTRQPSARYGRSPLYEALGVSYVYGAGAPCAVSMGLWPQGCYSAFFGSKSRRGLDCSGFAQMGLVRMGLMSPEEIDRSAAAMQLVCKPIQASELRHGDLVFYGKTCVTHVMVILPDRVAVIGASGGRSSTNGNVAGAKVKIYDRYDYRSDIYGFGRWPGGLVERVKACDVPRTPEEAEVLGKRWGLVA